MVDSTLITPHIASLEAINADVATQIATMRALTVGTSPPINNVGLWVGQSNMDGEVTLSQLPSYLAGGGNPNLQIYTGSGGWQTLSNGINNDSLEGQVPTSWGPEARFNDRFARDFPGRKLFNIKYAIPGSSMVHDWAPSVNYLYRNMANFITAAMAALSGIVPAPVIGGVFVAQGETEALDANLAAAYAPALAAFLSGIPTDWQTGNAPVIFARTRNLPFSGPVRAAQQSVPAPNKWIDTDSYPQQPDGLHFTAAGLAPADPSITSGNMGDDMYNAARAAGFGN